MSTIARLLLVVLCLRALTLPASAAPAANPFTVYAPYVVSRPDTRLVFARETVVDYQESSNIFTSNPDGTEPMQLTFATNRGGAQSPIWSPNGTWIAYERVDVGSVWPELWVMHANGSQAHALAFPTNTDFTGGNFTWAPDSTQIAATTTHGLALVSVTTMIPPRLVTSPYTPISSLTWASDGQHLAFDTYGSSANLYVLTLDGSPPRLVVPGGMWPVWSPDGTQIAYEMDRRLMIIKPDGTDSTVLTNNLNVIQTQPQWSPDGRTIALDIGPSTIGIVALNDAALVTINGGCCTNEVVGITWAPDSTRLIFTTAAYRSLHSYRARADGTQIEELPTWLTLPNWALR